VWGLVPVKGIFRQVTRNGTVSAAGDATGTITAAAGPCIPRTRGGTSTFPGRNVVRQILAYRRAERWAPLDEKADHVRGSPAGRLILEYGDYECPYSRQAFHSIEQVERRLGGNVRFAFRHPDAVHRRGGAPRRLRPAHGAGGAGPVKVIRSRGAR